MENKTITIQDQAYHQSCKAYHNQLVLKWNWSNSVHIARVSCQKGPICHAAIEQGCYGVGRKKFPDFSLIFPWLPTQIPVTVAIYTLWWFFAIYSRPHRNHIIHQKMLQHSDHENRSVQEKIVEVLCRTLWKQMKFKKIIWHTIFEWGHNLRFCPSSNIIRQTVKNMH